MSEIKREDEELIDLRINAKTLVKEIPKQTRRPKSPSLNHPQRTALRKRSVTFRSSSKVLLDLGNNTVFLMRTTWRFIFP